MNQTMEVIFVCWRSFGCQTEYKWCPSDRYLHFILDTVRRLDWTSLLIFSRIGHVRYINIQAWLRGFRVKIANFSSFFCPSIPKRDLDTKETTPNIEVWPESLGAMLEYLYIERGLFYWYTNANAVIWLAEPLHTISHYSSPLNLLSFLLAWLDHVTR